VPVVVFDQFDFALTALELQPASLIDHRAPKDAMAEIA